MFFAFRTKTQTAFFRRLCRHLAIKAINTGFLFAHNSTPIFARTRSLNSSKSLGSLTQGSGQSFQPTTFL
jgi:hypothetical protein